MIKNDFWMMLGFCRSVLNRRNKNLHNAEVCVCIFVIQSISVSWFFLIFKQLDILDIHISQIHTRARVAQELGSWII